MWAENRQGHEEESRVKSAIIVISDGCIAQGPHRHKQAEIQAGAFKDAKTAIGGGNLKHVLIGGSQMRIQNTFTATRKETAK